MKQRLRFQLNRNMFFTAVLMFLTACLSFQVYFYVGYGNLNAYTDTSEPAVKTGNELLLKNGTADYHFLDHFFKTFTLKLKSTDIKNIVNSVISDAADLTGSLLQAALYLIFFLFCMRLSCFLPGDPTLIKQKVRLND